MQSELDAVLRQPFFRKEADQQNYKKVEELNKKIDREDTQLKDARANILKHDKEMKDLLDEERHLKEEKEFYGADLRKLNTYMDASGLSIQQIRFKLQQEDPSLFRQAMEDLDLVGDEPGWEKQDILDRIENRDLAATDNLGDANQERTLKKEIDRLQRERGVLAAELQKS